MIHTDEFYSLQKYITSGLYKMPLGTFDRRWNEAQKQLQDWCGGDLEAYKLARKRLHDEAVIAACAHNIALAQILIRRGGWPETERMVAVTLSSCQGQWLEGVRAGLDFLDQGDMGELEEVYLDTTGSGAPERAQIFDVFLKKAQDLNHRVNLKAWDEMIFKIGAGGNDAENRKKRDLWKDVGALIDQLGAEPHYEKAFLKLADTVASWVTWARGPDDLLDLFSQKMGGDFLARVLIERFERDKTSKDWALLMRTVSPYINDEGWLKLDADERGREVVLHLPELQAMVQRAHLRAGIEKETTKSIERATRKM